VDRNHDDRVACRLGVGDGHPREEDRALVQRLVQLVLVAEQRPLDRVVFQLSNGVALVEAFFALARIGAIPVLALPAHRKSEIAHFARASGAVALMVPDVVRGFDYRELARDVAAECPDLRHVLIAGQAPVIPDPWIAGSSPQ
jgi:non-ribosomal peptide synthetase component E (peptide arylation enzyme)